MFEKSKLRGAIINGNIDEAKRILAKKPALLNMHLGDHYPRPLSLALSRGEKMMTDFLHDSGADVTLSGNRGRNMFFDVAYYGRLDVLKDWAAKHSSMLHETSWSGETLLHKAAERGHVDMVVWLLEHGGFNSEKNDEYGRTALYYAEKYQHNKVIAILKPLQEQSLRKYKDKAARIMAVPVEQKPHWRKLDDSRVARVQDDNAIGYRITEIFNFAVQERTRLYRNLETNAETVETRTFAELGEGALPDIRKALGAFRLAGGKINEDPIPALAQGAQQAPRLISKKP